MDIKRTVIALVISVAILIGWNYFAAEMGWIAPPPEETLTETPAEGAETAQSPDPLSAPAPLPAFAASPGREVVIETPLYRAVFHSGGAILREFTLKQFKVTLEENSPMIQMIDPMAASMAPLGLLINGAPSWSMGSWSLEGSDLNLTEGQKASLRFSGEIDGIRVVRELEFEAASYAIRETTRISSAYPAPLRLGYTIGSPKLDDGASQYNFTRIAYDQDGNYTDENEAEALAAGLAFEGGINWAAVMSNYFTVAVSPSDPDVAVRAKLQDGVYRIAVEKSGIIAPTGQEAVMSGIYYLGPKDQDQFKALPENMGSLIHYGFFSIISRPLIAMLKFFNGYTHNWGLAIILLTVLIKIILWPLSHKSYKSMQQMKKLQPMMAKIKDKYGDDKEAMNREIMQLYKTYKVNPMGGCLPLLLQIPIFFGLYQGLMSAIELRHAVFIAELPFTDWIWLADLSTKDPYYISPLIMGASMFFQQKLTPTAGDPTQAKIMLFMPLIFTALFLNFPSGLVIYWLTNNVISIGQQWWQLRKA